MQAMADEFHQRRSWLVRGTALLGVVVAAVLLLSNCGRSPQRNVAAAAESLLLNGQALAALEAVEVCLRRYPQDQDLQQLRVLALLKLSRFEIALTAIQQSADSTATVHAAMVHDDADIREGVMRLVAEQGLPVTCRDLVRTLNDHRAGVRRQGARAMGARRDCAADRPLYRLLNDDNDEVRRAAVIAFGERQDPRATGWLIAFCNSAGTNLMAETQTALIRLACVDNQELLRRTLQVGTPPQRLGAALALARLHDESALAVLLSAARQGEVKQRCRVILALAEYSGKGTTDALTALANDPEPLVRAEVARVLRNAARLE
jgi:HEAT repeat protein